VLWRRMFIQGRLPKGVAPGSDLRAWAASYGGEWWRDPEYRPGFGHDPTATWFVSLHSPPSDGIAVLKQWKVEIVFSLMPI
jgi:hypothetical protein